jgi:putative transposase
MGGFTETVGCGADIAWLNNFRRLSKDFEILTATSENMIRIAMIKLTLAKCI